MPTLAPTRSRAENVNRINRSFYESLWSGARLVEPNRFNTWPLVSKLVAQAPRRLEVAPGLRPRLPLDGTCFMDLSGAAIAALRTRNAMATRGSITALPYADASFDLVCALDILEHVVDDDGALSELTRVADPRAALLLSVPLHADAWTSFDDFVGHYRRYEPEDIAADWPRMVGASNKARSMACNPLHPPCSPSARSTSPSTGSARCGGTTGYSCPSACACRSR